MHRPRLAECGVLTGECRYLIAASPYTIFTTRKCTPHLNQQAELQLPLPAALCTGDTGREAVVKRQSPSPVFKLRRVRRRSAKLIGMSSSTFAVRFVGFALALLACLSLLPTAGRAQEGALDKSEPKGITPDEIIQRFAAKEKEFKAARDNYTYRQEVKVQTI